MHHKGPISVVSLIGSANSPIAIMKTRLLMSFFPIYVYPPTEITRPALNATENQIYVHLEGNAGDGMSS